MKRFLASTRPGFDERKRHSHKYMRAIGFSYLQDHPKWKQKELLRNYTKVVVVRNPFDRLRSCYYNKFVYYKHIGIREYVKAIKRYRIDPGDKNRTMHFDEFIQYILHARGDVHWETVDQSCSPCHVNYDVIMKAETLAQDLEAFCTSTLERSSCEGLYTGVYHPGRYRKERTLSPLGGVYVSHIPEFSTVSDVDIESVKRKYVEDLNMFGYTFDSDSFNASCSGVSSMMCC